VIGTLSGYGRNIKDRWKGGKKLTSFSYSSESMFSISILFSMYPFGAPEH